MITEGFLNVIFLFILGITQPLRILSDVFLPLALINSITSVSGYVSSVNSFFPADTLLQVIAFILALEASIFAYKAVMWIIKRIPTQS